MKKTNWIVESTITNKIHLISSQKAILDNGLAELYDVETKGYNQAVKRDVTRLQKEFMFQSGGREVQIPESLHVTSSWSETRKLPFAFNESWEVLLSGSHNSERAIAGWIQIIRIITVLRKLLFAHKDILLNLNKLEKKVFENSTDMQIAFSVLRELLFATSTSRKRIGFKPDDL